MAEEVTEATTNLAKLQLDEKTGEMVSKNELTKRIKKRARKAGKAATALAKGNANDAPAKTPARPSLSEPRLDADAMFKQGFLSDVYKERPVREVVTRFPPEPNGYLHLGHAKAIAVNFGFARYHGGKTILRFDDTNPEKEEEKYFIAIEETIRWLGFEPCAVTYSSDNFQRLYELAEKLIELGKAYVCHCEATEIKKQRGGTEGKEGPRYRCIHAEQDLQTNLQKFRDMRDGKYKHQGAFLRMKQDIESGNPQMWDLAAYRIPPDGKAHHYRTKDAWKIYPTYDFTHCLCDSFEGITHSLCTTEFVLSRESYEWLTRTLDVYEPMQREFGRLNINGTVMSKRALHQLVEEKIVRGWDDPRLYTLAALRRRGVPPGAILSFIDELGVTTAKTLIQISRFEQSIRRFLETTVPRLMLVLDPVRVVIEGAYDIFAGTYDVDVAFSPRDPGMGSRKLTLSRTVYIDRSDFREMDDSNFFRLAPGKTVGLLHFPAPIKATGFTKDENGRVVEIQAEMDRDSVKPKSFIQWVPEGSRTVEVRIHGHLFKSDDPTSVEGGFLQDLSPGSETIFSTAMIEDGFDEVRRRAPWPEEAGEKKTDASAPEGVRFQGMRIAYFAMDSDSTDKHVILNRIVTLKEDSAKN